jgi:hypothetical protein
MDLIMAALASPAEIVKIVNDRQRRCYMLTEKCSAEKKKLLVVSLKGLVAKMN